MKYVYYVMSVENHLFGGQTLSLQKLPEAIAKKRQSLFYQMQKNLQEINDLRIAEQQIRAVINKDQKMFKKNSERLKIVNILMEKTRKKQYELNKVYNATLTSEFIGASVKDGKTYKEGDILPITFDITFR